MSIGYVLSARSESRLVGVHPALADVTRRAIRVSEIDFMVTEGVRTLERQRLLVAEGASQTLNSRHLTGHAVDLAALIAGQVAWDWPLYHKIATAMRTAAVQAGVVVTWGGVWDKPLNSITGDLGAELAAYVARRKRAGDGRPFVDGPHFQLDPAKYPQP